MTTMRDAINDVRRIVYGSLTEQINLVNVSASAGANSLVLELGVDGIQKGTVLSSGLNVWYVKNVLPSAGQVFVIPGYDGAPLAPAEPGDIVYVRPRMTEWYAFNAINDEIRRLSSPVSGLYKIGRWVTQVDPSYQTYDVPVEARNMIQISRVRFRVPGTPDYWMDLPNVAWRWQSESAVPRVILLRNIPSSAEIEFTYQAPFSQAVSLDDDLVNDCGLSDSMTDIPALGAAVMLLRTTEARRNQIHTQGDARRSGEVPPASNATIANQLERDYRARVNDEYTRLVSRSSIFKGI
jgi:hypothetical protein